MRPMTVLRMLLAVLAASLLGCGSGQTENENSRLSVYVDPNGYFAILPPAGWRVQRYRNEPRGKVAFFASDGTELRVLVKAVGSTDYDERLENAKEIERELGIEMNIEPIDFVGLPAIKRVTTFTTGGGHEKIPSD